MPALIQMIRRTLGLACVCFVVAAPRASAGPAVVADFDGDGQRDHATLDSHYPSSLRVWLSTTHTISILNARSPLLGVAAQDLDGDRRDELIVSGTSGLQVWTTRLRGFKPFRPRQGPPRALASPTRQTVDEGPGDALPAVLPAGASSLVLARTRQHGRPSFVSTGLSPRSAVPAILARTLAPFAPRPPPLAL